MRLDILNRGHRWLEKLVLKAINLQMGYSPGPVQISMYRSDFFGRPFTVCTEEALRKAKHWRRSETELFAAFVSRQNHCHF